jgi:hypothetical protein
MARWEQKINSNLQLPTDPAAVAAHVQIRDRLASMKDTKERMSFLEKHGSDLTLISAVLTAPAYLSGLDDGELAYVRSKLEKLAPPEIVNARKATQKAMAEVERGWRAAPGRVTARAAKPNLKAERATDAKPAKVENKPVPVLKATRTKSEPSKAAAPVWSTE